MTEPFHDSAQRFDRTPVVAHISAGEDLALVLFAGSMFLFMAIFLGAPTWVVAVLTSAMAVLLAAAIVYLCRRPEDTPDPDQEPRTP